MNEYYSVSFDGAAATQIADSINTESVDPEAPSNADFTLGKDRMRSAASQ